MFKFYEEMYANNDGFLIYVQQGCFSPKFATVLLECNPPTDKMELLRKTASLDYFSQVQFFFSYNNDALKELYVLRNLSSEDVFVDDNDIEGDDDDDNDGHDDDDDDDDDAFCHHHNHYHDKGSEKPRLVHPGWNSGHLPTQPAPV